MRLRRLENFGCGRNQNFAAFLAKFLGQAKHCRGFTARADQRRHFTAPQIERFREPHVFFT
jgi:hypothetical protein